MDTQTYNFTVTFTRPDEQDAHVYTIGYNVEAVDRATAERKLLPQFAHLTVIAVALSAVMDEEGTVTVWACPKCGVAGPSEQCDDCGRSRQQIPETVALQRFMEAHEPPTGWYNDADVRLTWARWQAR